ncbi:MAG: serine/threonine protein kinase [Candidatus Coatesbacteria bacterium]|nr:MAG: serine/threonine protein kinase [Candidatus Coatesbacteria bacterium]
MFNDGDLVADRYKLVENLGSGGMADVWRARDLRDGRGDVALKFIRPDFVRMKWPVEFFGREVMNSKKLTAPTVVRVYDLDREGDVWFVVMEYVDGEDLDERLARYKTDEGRAFTVEETLEVARDVCAAVEHAHGENILHLDLKPGNIMAVGSGGYKLMDFGLASPYGTRATRDRKAPGYSSGYSPPEQVLGRQIDRRSDVYSLAATFYELLAGKPPHARTDYAAAYEIPEPIKGIPKHINATLLAALSKSPAFRPASATELLNALEGDA